MSGTRKKPGRGGAGAHATATDDGYPTAFELAMLAAANGGDLDEAERRYNKAAEHLRRWKARTPDEQMARLNYEELDEMLRNFHETQLQPRKLYCDTRADDVKDSIAKATGRRCGYKTARDHLRGTWLYLREKQAIPKTVTNEAEGKRWKKDYRSKHAAADKKAWGAWCDSQRRGGDGSAYLSIPGDLLAITVARLTPKEPEPLHFARRTPGQGKKQASKARERS